jgi:hypothetical protein
VFFPLLHSKFHVNDNGGNEKGQWGLFRQFSWEVSPALGRRYPKSQGENPVYQGRVNPEKEVKKQSPRRERAGVMKNRYKNFDLYLVAARFFFWSIVTQPVGKTCVALSNTVIIQCHANSAFTADQHNDLARSSDCRID